MKSSRKMERKMRFTGSRCAVNFSCSAFHVPSAGFLSGSYFPDTFGGY